MDNFVCFAFECLAILLLLMYASSGTSNCSDEYCFTYPGADVTRSFDDARSWCAINDLSTLAVVNNEYSHDKLIKFLSLSNISSLYINTRLNQSSVNTWYIINGERFNGEVVDQTDKENTYKLYTSLEKWSKEFAVRASNPQGLENYICKYRADSGLSILPNTSYRDSELIYVKYENETLTWFEARNRCYLKGGDLATFSYLSNLNTTWLSSSSSYWIGFRWQNRCWKNMDNGEEIIYTRWSSGKPNSLSSECVCIERSVSWNWTDCDCITPRSFVCVKYRSISTTTPTSTAISSAASGQTVHYVSRTTEYSNKLAIGVGVGLGAAILLAVVVVVVVVIVTKKRKSKQGTTERPNKAKDEQRPKQKPKKPKDPEVVQQTNNFPEYADIMPLAQPIVREPTRSPIFYSNPEFVATTPS